jgi:hypothetical protein
MSNETDPYKNAEKDEKNTQFQGSGVYVREDDQDWGSSGMNDIKASE